MAVIYQDDIEVPGFAGINQSGDGYNMSMRYAVEAYNADVTGGALAPMRDGKSIGHEVTAPIETLALLHRRYHTAPDEQDLLVAVAGGLVYTKLLDHDDPWVMRYAGLTNSRCDWVTYEVNATDSDAPTDVLLLTNADDGMIMLFGDSLRCKPVPTPEKFGSIARYNERIWGSGIKDQPDKLMYSAPYDPTDWAQNDDIPEDGAGDILQPSWDGDNFIALKTFGSYLLAFKKNAVWKVYGTHPGEFVMKEQYGLGAVVGGSIAVTSAYALMLGWTGIVRYDGSSTEPFQQQAIRDVMARLNFSARAQCAGVVDGKRYLLAIPLDDSEINNAVIEYNITDRTWSVRTGVYVKAWLAFDDRLLYTDARTPSTVKEFDKGPALPLVWVSAFQDNQQKSAVKSNMTLYFTVTGEKAYVPLTFRIRTEKKVKEKFVLAESGKAKRINVNASGRYFRLEIASHADFGWRLNSGVQIHFELDPD